MTVVAPVAASGTEAASWVPTTSSVRPASRSASVSPMQTMAVRPPARIASALARTAASVSPWSARRSEWPTITWVAPASASIATEMSPVWAPEAAAWQSCPPTPMWAARAAMRERSVAGGQRTMSTAGAGWAATRASTSARCAVVPFIFQLPAASFLRMPSLLGSGRAGCCRPGARGQAPRAAESSSTSLNLIDSPQPQASATFGLRNLKPDSRRLVW